MFKLARLFVTEIEIQQVKLQLSLTSIFQNSTCPPISSCVTARITEQFTIAARFQIIVTET